MVLGLVDTMAQSFSETALHSDQTIAACGAILAKTDRICLSPNRRIQ